MATFSLGTISLTMTLTFPRTLQSQGHWRHVNLFRNLPLSKTQRKRKEDANWGTGFNIVFSIRMVFCHSLGTAGRRAGHTRLQPRCPSDLGRSAGPDCYPLGSTGQHKLATQALWTPTLHLYCTYSSLLGKQLPSLAASGLAGTHQPHRTRTDRSLLITLSPSPPHLLSWSIIHGDQSEKIMGLWVPTKSHTNHPMRLWILHHPYVGWNFSKLVFFKTCNSEACLRTLFHRARFFLTQRCISSFSVVLTIASQYL